MSLSHPIVNKKWILTAYPQGTFVPSKHAKLLEEKVGSELQEDEMLIQVKALSVDAFVRTMLKKDAFHGSVELNNVIPSLGYGVVIQAGPKAKFSAGTDVSGMLGGQTFLKTKDTTTLNRMMKLPFLRPRDSLGLFGISTGFTAFAGIFYAPPRPPRKGETVIVSAAAGAVGSIAAQLARTTGARVIGIAGGPTKAKFLVDTLKLDGAIDYKSSSSLDEQLDKHCPDGVDFYFDNVGGETLDAILGRINTGGRVVICGAISQYEKDQVQGPGNYIKLAERNASMTGFTVMHYLSRLPKMWFWLMWYHWRGQVVMHEHIDMGIESFAPALAKLFSGGNVGKMIVDVTGELK